MSPRWRRRAAIMLFCVASVAWPVTQFTIARDEPPFTLALSWFAIILTCVDIAATSDARATLEDQ